MDPPTVVLVARALCQAGQKPGPTTREVCELTEAMAEKLEKAATLHDSSAGDELQQFCIELVRGVHRQPTFRRDPDLKPYRH
jgi:hypothetical protein